MVFNHHRLRGNGCLAARGEDEGFLTIPLPGVNGLREWNSIYIAAKRKKDSSTPRLE